MSTSGLVIRPPGRLVKSPMALKDNLKTARKAKGWSQSDLAREAGVSQQLISQIENGLESAGKDMLPTIAAALGIEVTDLDRDYWRDHPIVRAVTSGSLVRNDAPSAVVLPLFGSVRGGRAEMILGNTEIGSERHPLEGVRDAYAVYVVGESMEPLFAEGDRLLVNPHAPATANADVILKSELRETGDRFAMVKRLIRVAQNDWHLKQFNPVETFKISRGEYPVCHVIVGKYSKR
jgi:transcriptional regulator with XRE-family HTH domain